MRTLTLFVFSISVALPQPRSLTDEVHRRMAEVEAQFQKREADKYEAERMELKEFQKRRRRFRERIDADYCDSTKAYGYVTVKDKQI